MLIGYPKYYLIHCIQPFISSRNPIWSPDMHYQLIKGVVRDKPFEKKDHPNLSLDIYVNTC